MKFYLIQMFVLLMLAAAFPVLVSAQTRDYLTDNEIEVVRDAQQIDKRVDVLIHAMDRRFGVLKINVNAPGGAESKDWGAMPSGTRPELLFDIRRILEKAIDDIDNLAERPSSMLVEQPEKGNKIKGYAELFPKAVRDLAAAVERYKIPLKKELDTAPDATEKGSILDALDLCDEITAAATKLKN